MGIWRNIGKIVSLSLEIVYLEMKWYIDTFKSTDKPKTLNEKEKKYLNEEQESIERSRVILTQYDYEYTSTNDQVEWSENPFPQSK